MHDPNFELYPFTPVLEEEMISRSEDYFHYMNRRRSVRSYSNKPVPRAILENIIKTASTSPSGAHKQPWTFCLIGDQDIKRQIREAAEKEEYKNYHGRMSDSWMKDLRPFRTDWRKPFLEQAPWLIIVFKKPYDLVDGIKQKNYYVNESVGLACGFLVSAIHNAGLVSLTHTPSPMKFLENILDRPVNERAFLVLPVGYPDPKATVPALKRKGWEEIGVIYD
jgi:nitroreductase